MAGTMDNALAQGIVNSSLPASPTVTSTSPVLPQQQSAPVTPVPERLYTLSAMTPHSDPTFQPERVETPDPPVDSSDPSVVNLLSSSPEPVDNSDDNSTVPGVGPGDPTSAPTSPVPEERTVTETLPRFVEQLPTVARNEEESLRLETAEEHVGSTLGEVFAVERHRRDTTPTTQAAEAPPSLEEPDNQPGEPGPSTLTTSNVPQTSVFASPDLVLNRPPAPASPEREPIQLIPPPPVAADAANPGLRVLLDENVLIPPPPPAPARPPAAGIPARS